MKSYKSILQCLKKTSKVLAVCQSLKYQFRCLNLRFRLISENHLCYLMCQFSTNVEEILSGQSFLGAMQIRCSQLLHTESGASNIQSSKVLPGFALLLLWHSWCVFSLSFELAASYFFLAFTGWYWWWFSGSSCNQNKRKHTFCRVLSLLAWLSILPLQERLKNKITPDVKVIWGRYLDSFEMG